MQDLTGRHIGRYKILKSIGEGGMASVYLAEDTNLERQVALKVIRAERVTPEQLPRIMERFKREAKALARLSDEPGIVTVYDYGEYEGTPYLVMAFMPGGTLKDRLGNPFQAQAAADMLLPIARALMEAHAQGLIHRDVKPSNLLVDKHGSLALADFGIAKALEVDGQTLTSTGMGVGTPEYMAPEQWRGKATPQTDVYSLGVVLYEMLTGKKPFQAENPSDIYLKQMTEEPPDPACYVNGLPEAAATVLKKSMARQPEERYADMGAFRLALAKMAAGYLLHDETPATINQPIGMEMNSESTLDELATPAPVGAVEQFQILPKVKFEAGASKEGSKGWRKWWLAGVLVVVVFVAVIGLGVVIFKSLMPEAMPAPPKEIAAVQSTISSSAATKVFLITEAPSKTPTRVFTATPAQIPSFTPNLPSDDSQTEAEISSALPTLTSGNCTPGGIFTDVQGDASPAYMDIHKVESSLEGENLTVVMYLQDLPDEVTVNQAAEGMAEYDWSVEIDVDSDASTGYSTISNNVGIEYSLRLFHWSRASTTPQTGSIDQLMKSDIDVWQHEKDGRSTIGEGTMSVNYENRSITIRGKVPGINKDSLLYFSTALSSEKDSLCN